MKKPLSTATKPPVYESLGGNRYRYRGTMQEVTITPATIRKYLQTIGQLGGKARAAKLTKAQRLASSRKANAAKANKRRTT